MTDELKLPDDPTKRDGQVERNNRTWNQYRDEILNKVYKNNPSKKKTEVEKKTKKFVTSTIDIDAEYP